LDACRDGLWTASPCRMKATTLPIALVCWVRLGQCASGVPRREPDTRVLAEVREMLSQLKMLAVGREVDSWSAWHSAYIYY